MKRMLFKALFAVSNVMENGAAAFMRITGKTIWVVLSDEELKATIRRAKVIHFPKNGNVLVKWVDWNGEGLCDLHYCHFTEKRAQKWIDVFVYPSIAALWANADEYMEDPFAYDDYDDMDNPDEDPEDYED